jgi:hypothetical protein
MPTTVTDSGGNVRHLWQLPDLTTPEPEDETEYSSISVPLTDGYRCSIQTGFDAGTKRWKLQAPTLAHYEVLPVLVTDVNGAQVSRLDYVWSLFEYTQKTGEPFVYTDQASGEQYFAEFADEGLTMTRMKVKIFGAGLNFRQVRLAGLYIP